MQKEQMSELEKQVKEQDRVKIYERNENRKQELVNMIKEQTNKIQNLERKLNAKKKVDPKSSL